MTMTVGAIFVLLVLTAGISATPIAFADHNEVTIIAPEGSGFPGCEETAEGCFQPKVATVDVGGKVIFKNIDNVGHTATSGVLTDDEFGTVFDSGLALPGSAYEWTPAKVGEYPYLCIVHPWRVGLIIVQEAESDTELTITTNLPKEVVELNLGEKKEIVLGLNSTVNATYTVTATPKFLNSSDPGLTGNLSAHAATHAGFAVHAVQQGKYKVTITATTYHNSVSDSFVLHVASPEQVNLAYAIPNTEQRNIIVFEQPGGPDPDPGPDPDENVAGPDEKEPEVRRQPSRSTGGGGSVVFAPDGDVIKLYSISWDCNEEMVRAVIGDGLDHTVKLSTSEGQFEMPAAARQDLSGRTIYEVNMFDPIIVLSVHSTAFFFNTVYSIDEVVRAEPCVGEKVFLEYTSGTTRPQVEPEPPVEPVPEPVVEPEPQVEPEPTAEPIPEPTFEPVPEQADPDPVVVPPTTQPVPPVECAEGTVLSDGICVAEDDGGCLIATAAYGSELAPQVQHLREIRDGSLVQTSAGAGFMSAFNTAYYSFSPTISDWQRQSPAFNDAVRVALTPMLATLGIMDLQTARPRWCRSDWG